MKKELVALSLILFAFSTGMILTAATSGCHAQSDGTADSGTDKTLDTHSALSTPDNHSTL